MEILEKVLLYLKFLIPKTKVIIHKNGANKTSCIKSNLPIIEERIVIQININKK